jgi:hypothetical protein
MELTGAYIGRALKGEKPGDLVVGTSPCRRWLVTCFDCLHDMGDPRALRHTSAVG